MKFEKGTRQLNNTARPQTSICIENEPRSTHTTESKEKEKKIKEEQATKYSERL